MNCEPSNETWCITEDTNPIIALEFRLLHNFLYVVIYAVIFSLSVVVEAI